MKLLPLVWTALWRKPGETLLVCLAVTAAFTLFGLMSGLHATYRAIVHSARQDRLEVGQRFPMVTHGLRMPIAMREQIARIPGVRAAGPGARERNDPGTSSEAPQCGQSASRSLT